MKIHSFQATLDLIGINPFVFVPADILEHLFVQAGKTKGPIPIHGSINTVPYKQTLVKYSGAWRLYINTSMLKNSPKRIGETIDITVGFDPLDRSIEIHPTFKEALEKDPAAKQVFDQLRPSLQHEIVRYLASLKTEAALNRNITRAIAFLNYKERFVGRDKP